MTLPPAKVLLHGPAVLVVLTGLAGGTLRIDAASAHSPTASIVGRQPGGDPPYRVSFSSTTPDGCALVWLEILDQDFGWR